MGREAREAHDWIEAQGLADAERLGEVLSVVPGWEQAVETVLGDYLQAVCVDGLDQVAGALEGLEHGSLALLDEAS